MRRIAIWILTAAAAPVVACGTPGTHPATESAAVLATTPSTESAAAVPADTTTPPAGPSTQAHMPDVTCMILQDAQDRIQTAGIFFSRSEDATGAGRMQIVDRNWAVVSQSPAPGIPIGEGDAVLSVVKLGEPGDCS